MNALSDTLFPDLEPVDLPTPEPVEKLSAGRRLTLRQKDNIARGYHPLMPTALADNGETCGSCRFRRPGRYAKCWWRPGDSGPYPYITNGPATDCRAWWPACPKWEATP